MDITTGAKNQETVSNKRHHRVPNGGKGRPKGAKNKLTREMLQSVMRIYQEKGRETAGSFWRKVLGIDALEGAMIDGKAIAVRETLMKAMAEVGLPAKQRTIKLMPIDLEFIRMAMNWAYGMPGKAAPDRGDHQRMPYIGRHGLPWQYDVMFEQEQQALEAQKDQEKLDAAARERQLKGEPEDPKPEDPKPDEADGEETLEIVRG